MTECPKCKGYGIVGSAVPDILRGRGAIFSSNECDMCHGSGEVSEVEMTNEEWLRSCPPQELIRFLMNVAYGGQIRNVQKRTFDEEAEKWSKWLKEKHTE